MNSLAHELVDSLQATGRLLLSAECQNLISLVPPVFFALIFFTNAHRMEQTKPMLLVLLLSKDLLVNFIRGKTIGKYVKVNQMMYHVSHSLCTCTMATLKKIEFNSSQPRNKRALGN